MKHSWGGLQSEGEREACWQRAARKCRLGLTLAMAVAYAVASGDSLAFLQPLGAMPPAPHRALSMGFP